LKGEKPLKNFTSFGQMVHQMHLYYAILCFIEFNPHLMHQSDNRVSVVDVSRKYY